jgi:hypothetical protein
LTTHARRYQKLYRVSGHVWQGRFKAFPICEDEHLLTVLRYLCKEQAQSAEKYGFRSNYFGALTTEPQFAVAA